jgi:hypothetical protein
LGEHELNPVKDREGDLVGAAVFLSPEEVETLRETGSVEIESKDR